MALSGIDLALWDLLGRAERQPVYALLGGKSAPRLSARTRRATTPNGIAERWASARTRCPLAAPRVTRRISSGPRPRPEASRRHLGADALLMFDCYMAWDADTTRAMARTLAPYNIYWFEDTLTPDDLDGLAELRRQIKPAQLAGGEHDFTHHRFAAIAQAGALDIWQPDVTWCGGITAARRIVRAGAGSRRARGPAPGR